ncbi:MarR family winged helix-turn-helix transcriptional regulator [Methanococcoides alaskense]|uniref:DNA-binding MarR family transcriptional regulator n=1 Tax=Methanococcoides alaskense TaxID=325778 RepID=A0AA90ZDQ7_9EURY|nr:MarR family transcriptional regulator [Methanococcoides alaskense]MDA0524207.1 MarR family transcriptional regulator [Methanococcoides alaskense]MDR6223672.1 DNA-binding MarR family transcriptional regulator [Methanococcoides alaskense]
MPVQLSFEKVDKYYQKILTKNEKLEKYADVSYSSFSYLAVVRSLVNPTISELASAMDVKKPSASTMVKKLVDMGLLEVERSISDKRVCNLTLSAEGNEVIELGRSADDLFFGKVEEVLDDNEFETFAGLWEKITSNLEVDGGK